MSVILMLRLLRPCYSLSSWILIVLDFRISKYLKPRLEAERVFVMHCGTVMIRNLASCLNLVLRFH